MTDATILCPKCQTEIKLTESLAAPLLEVTRRTYEQRLAEQETSFQQREMEVRKAQADLTEARKRLDAEVAEQLATERQAIAAEESRKARQLLAHDLAEQARKTNELEEVLRERDAKLVVAQQTQAEALRKQRELDDARRELELSIERRLQEALPVARAQAKQEAEEGLKLRVAEKEQTIAALQRQIDDLKRRAEQGSQQLQGEVQELELEAQLQLKFPLDRICPVPKGEHGGDTLQFVCGPLGQECGTILWECKRTKHWSDGWLCKLRDDQRNAGAELAVLVSHALPSGVESFDLIDGVWVTSPRTLLPLAIALRGSLVELALARQAAHGEQTKTELVYRYLTGPRFRQRVLGIIEKFSQLSEDLDKERRVILRQWAKREQLLRGALESAAGLYGDLQGIAGKSLQEIEGLDWASLEHRPLAVPASE